MEELRSYFVTDVVRVFIKPSAKRSCGKLFSSKPQKTVVSLHSKGCRKRSFLISLATTGERGRVLFFLVLATLPGIVTSKEGRLKSSFFSFNASPGRIPVSSIKG